MDPSIALLRRDSSYRAYWYGQSISALGSQVTAFALPLVAALTLDATPGQVGLVAAAGTAPYLAFSLLAGHWLEGRAHQRVMIPADLVQCVALALIPVAWLGGWLSVSLLVAIAFTSGCGALAFGVSAFAYVPRLVDVPDLAAANRAAQGARTVSEISGPGLGGILVGALGAPLAIALDAASYLASALGIARSRPRPHPPVGSSGAGDPRSGLGVGERENAGVLDGMRVLFANRYLRALTVHAAVFNLAEEIYLINLLLWAVRHQDVSPATYGLALSAGGIGGLIGTLTALRLMDRLGLGRAFLASLVLSCGTPVLTGLFDLRGMALAMLIGLVSLMAGIGLGNANVYSVTLRQSAIPEHVLTRSAGAYTQVMYGSIPLGAILAGLVGTTAGPRVGVVVGAVVMAASILPMAAPTVRSLRAPQDAVAHHR